VESCGPVHNRPVQGLLYIESLRIIYSTYFESLLQYGIIVSGTSTNTGRVFIFQKRIIRIMMGGGPKGSCKGLFEKLSMLPVPCLYTLSLMMFIVNNLENFQTNLHDIV